ncbi:predicted protein [Ostreococcus lucimarinus CCE9901]|jgi:coatomer subunit beta|uniref:Coatomer subunit beta n=2 Tax=Ostreococcus sp. 'lucimarinus' TaxID=242159 RepID=A4RW30_OSTLU|nr:predicted protein [Ostreococcus lucimarinus CCE9901]ABO95545.1 predicted protein [Ostreococcus lucimarinus CCE9901]|tara:strand:+ start:2207 stop:5017 length:2811 start_codon:yes stop_codon:yes gene_type:complete|eukprot:XP_001417252.1 predicted protein [Ostreococcus lucimarinus CCE9901]
MATVNQVVERGCSMLVHFDRATSAVELKEALETGNAEEKADAMKKVISLLLSGEAIPQVFITIVRYVLPSDDHTVQKLLLLYMEMIEKCGADGKILPEMILLCQNLRNNLQHPNEFLRGCTLRFLCRITEPDLLEPLIPSIVQNLEHRHSYVRRNAVMAINKIYDLPDGEHLIPDAPEIIESFLMSGENDLGTRRNAFLMLYTHAQERAVNYLMNNLESVSNWGDILQTVVLDLIRKVCRSDPTQKGKYIKVILMLLGTNNASVVYECANTLVALSNAPTAIKAAANCYCQLLVNQSDNNVKLIVLDRLTDLKKDNKELLQAMIMDILRAISSPNIDIKRKTLDLVLDLITPRNIDDVTSMLKTEVIKSQSENTSETGEYRQLLVQAIHKCALKFPEVAGSVIYLLMDFLSDANSGSSADVAYFVREIAFTNKSLRPGIIEHLLDLFSTIRSSRVCATALWIIGEFSTTQAEQEAALEVIRMSLGPAPLVDGPDGEEEDEDTTETTTRPAVLADGTYATQAAYSTSAAISQVPNLREMLLKGDSFLSAVIASTLTKLALRVIGSGSVPQAQKNATQAECMLYIVSMLRLGTSGKVPIEMDRDSKARLELCFHVIGHPEEADTDVWLKSCGESFALMIEEKLRRESQASANSDAAPVAQADDLIDFHHLKSRKGMTQLEIEDAVATDLARATGFMDSVKKNGRSLDRVMQLTGLSDTVYAETYVTVHQYDITLDVTMINRTDEPLQNVMLELSTMGDLKLVERPQPFSLPPFGSHNLRASIKVSSTETGVIFGNIVYETARSDRNVIVLNDVHIDIMDYIIPATCSDTVFRSMWAEFEWENKVAVSTNITDVRKYLDHIVTSTNMKCLTPPSALDGECGFLAANLYAKSVFGEDALVNVSIESNDGEISGFIRIRSKTQGIALSLGDKITLKQSIEI